MMPDRVALRDPNVAGNPVLAVMDIASIETLDDEQVDTMTRAIFGTLDPGHPGVAVFRNLGNHCVAGSIQVLNFSYFEQDFPDTFRTAVDIRTEIDRLGWETTVAFQTRNPMHRAHEELCRIAMERLGADGLVIHMLLGKLKAGDIPGTVRDACIRRMVADYFPENAVMVTGYGFDMLFAGPREALLHAIFRQNMGATHLIVGRDHAGVGDYYGPFDAQEIFARIPPGALEIDIFAADHTAYSRKLGRVVMMREAPDHTPEDYILLSGTKMREMLQEGIQPPPELTRPEVAAILVWSTMRAELSRAHPGPNTSPIFVPSLSPRDRLDYGWKRYENLAKNCSPSRRKSVVVTSSVPNSVSIRSKLLELLL